MTNDVMIDWVKCIFWMKEKLEQLPCEQFLQAFEISRSFLRAKKVGEKRGKFNGFSELKEHWNSWKLPSWGSWVFESLFKYFEPFRFNDARNQFRGGANY